MRDRSSAFRRSRLALTLLAAVLTVAACGLGERGRDAGRIHGARAKAVAQRTAAGVLTLKVTPERGDAPAAQEAPEGVAALAGAAGVAGPVELQAQVQLRLGDHLSQIAMVPAEPAADGAPPAASTIFREGTILVKRTKLRPEERRTWAKLDLRRLPEDEPRLPREQLEGVSAAITGINSLNPEHVLDLVGGALPGSVRRVGREDVGGVPTTRYKANISIDRAVEELDLTDEEEVARRLVIRLLLGSVPDVRPAQFWIDDQGLLRRSTFSFRQRITRTETNDLELSLELPQYGTPVEIPSPSEEETVEVERYGRLMRASLPAET